MRTEAQNEASRANGAKSRGPVTPEGKAASSRNAVRHGLLSRTVVVEGEAEDRFQEHVEALVQEFDPQTETEMACIENMATARWHKLSAWGMQTATLSDEIRNQADHHPDLIDKDPAVRAFMALKELTAASPVIRNLQRYEVTLDRAYYRALNVLKASQKERIAKQTQDQPLF